MPNWCSNSLSVTGSEDDIRRFKLKANGPEQSYHDYNAHGVSWPIHDDVRLKALYESMPESGESSVFSFHALFPVPSEVRQLPYDTARAKKLADRLCLTRTHVLGGYDWECANWGVKWGASNPDLQEDEDSFLQYIFDTAWAPPLDFLKKVSKDWPSLTFGLDYEEPGMGFAGEVEIWNGEETSHEERELEDEEEDSDD
jgi:hypothetical protein